MALTRSASRRKPICTLGLSTFGRRPGAALPPLLPRRSGEARSWTIFRRPANVAFHQFADVAGIRDAPRAGAVFHSVQQGLRHPHVDLGGLAGKLEGHGLELRKIIFG